MLHSKSIQNTLLSNKMIEDLRELESHFHRLRRNPGLFPVSSGPREDVKSVFWKVVRALVSRGRRSRQSRKPKVGRVFTKKSSKRARCRATQTRRIRATTKGFNYTQGRVLRRLQDARAEKVPGLDPTRKTWEQYLHNRAPGVGVDLSRAGSGGTVQLLPVPALRIMAGHMDEYREALQELNQVCSGALDLTTLTWR